MRINAYDPPGSSPDAVPAYRTHPDATNMTAPSQHYSHVEP